MRPSFFTGLLWVLLSSACGDTPPSSPAAPPPAPTAAATVPRLPSIPVDSLVVLYEQATYLDATFYDLPVSINQNDPAQIRSSLTHIGEAPANLSPTCKPFGRVWFQIDGVNRQEADIYFADGCTYFVWFRDGKPAYSNAMTESGVAFYNNILRSLQDPSMQQ